MTALLINTDHPEEWPESVLRAAAAELGRRGTANRAQHKGGRKPNPKPCPFCGDPYSGRAMREHKPICRKSGKRTGGGWHG